MKIKRFIAVFFLAGSIALAWGQDENPVLKTRYASPATNWEKEALPLGNGRIGGMVFGGVAVDVILVNEKTLWSGGPGKNPNYNGGHQGTPAENHRTLQSVRNALQQKMTDFTAKHAAKKDANGKVTASDYAPEDDELKAGIQNLTGNRDDFGSYRQLSNIHIAYNSPAVPEYTGYSRELNIDNAVAKTSYHQNGVNYAREYFISHPDNVIVIRLTADKTSSVSCTFYFTSPQKSVNVSATNNVVTLEGKPTDHGDNGLKFAQQMMIIPTGGMMSNNDSAVTVENADEILLLSSAATNYQQSMDDGFNYFSNAAPRTTVENTLKAAARKTYAQLLEAHLQDYKSLYGKMSVSLGNAANADNKPTDELLKGYKDNTNTPAENLYLEQLYYQFGRYLLISSSRKGSLPANLQGIWAEGLKPPWDADYHTNINVQMNYWPAQQTNLSDCHIPVIEYVKSLVPRGRITARHYYCKQDGSPVRGWVIHHENNIWGNTAPGNWYTAFYFPAAAAWMCQDIWEYYQFNQDKKFLEEYYPVMVDAALFWVDNLWRDSRDGTLVANPSYSPEHGFYSLGASADQAIIWELFDMVEKASDALGRHTPEIQEIKTAKSGLAGPRIGLTGQLMEWKDELLMDITGDNGHRHVNHLYWLHPGSRIVPGRSEEEDLYAKAMQTTLNTRGDGGTGWSKAWKINFRARLHDGNRSHKLVQEILKESTSTNLFDMHPPFQIDGNFGATAGMTEMLLQSHGGYIEILPSLPDAWANGSFKGIKARGNFEIDAEWSNGEITSLKITSGSGNDCMLKYNGDIFSFPTVAGTAYDLSKKKIKAINPIKKSIFGRYILMLGQCPKTVNIIGKQQTINPIN
ncbi:MAG: glycoside hydrolase N-terminal domain-containing protein [Proteiniphilum sp.]|jgi:alpha-L-fucosidase 2|nr:glycoside hydrolase N-terminal domain-containing protein [Proteiniphilum sp.]